MTLNVRYYAQGNLCSFFLIFRNKLRISILNTTRARPINCQICTIFARNHKSCNTNTNKLSSNTPWCKKWACYNNTSNLLV